MERTIATYHGLKMTADEYLQLPDDGHRYELIEGVLYMVPSPLRIHQKVSLRLTLLLDDFVEEHHLGELYNAPLDVHLSLADIYQPDIIFVSAANAAILQDWIRGAPDLVVEILSPGTAQRDLGSKKKNYARYGVKEYWVVDPYEQRFEFYILEKDAFVMAKPEGDLYRSPVVKGFELDIDHFWRLIFSS